MKIAKIMSVAVLVCVFIMTAILMINSAVSNANSEEDEKIKKQIGEALGVDPSYIVVAHGGPRDHHYEQLSEEELKSDTETLLSLIFNSKYLFYDCMYLSTINTPSKGQYERQKSEFNGLAEFAKREDAVSVLWAKYENEYLGVKTLSHEKCMIESMLISDDFYPKLTQEQKDALNDNLMKG